MGGRGRISESKYVAAHRRSSGERLMPLTSDPYEIEDAADHGTAIPDVVDGEDESDPQQREGTR